MGKPRKAGVEPNLSKSKTQRPLNMQEAQSQKPSLRSRTVSTLHGLPGPESLSELELC